MSRLLYPLALTLVRSVGPITARQMISYCGSAEAVFKEKRSALIKIPNIGPRTIDELRRPEVLTEAELELDRIGKQGISTYYYLDEDYPRRLKPFPDSPLLIFYQGQDILNHPRTLGIVGTRKPSSYGLAACERIIEEMQPFDPLVISGLAYGIDAVSHRKALAVGLPTLGVMGNGLAITYPAAHRRLRKQMIEKGGVLSEFPFLTTPEREHFPMRNRIIAAMSDALLVVESARKGGSMITAHFAFEYNKDLFALPGRVDDPLSAGPNFLIKNDMASLAEGGMDIAGKMLWEKPDHHRQHTQLELFTALDEREQRLVDLIREHPEEPVSIDLLHYRSGISMSELSGLLLSLELRSVIKSLPGSRFTFSGR